jgi:SAM-dependent methyltransferase
VNLNEDVIRFQAEHHPLEGTNRFESEEHYCLYLMHLKAYEQITVLARGKTVLDLGCNNGWGTQVISHEAQRVVGVDVSQKAVDEARRLAVGGNVEFQRYDGKHLPFNDGVFDLVASCQVIEHIADYASYLGEIRRVLTKDGLAVFTTPNERIRLDVGMKPWSPFHVHEFNAAELTSLLGGVGFIGVRVMGLFATPELYQIEFRRNQRARENARRRASQWLPPYVELKAKFIDSVKLVLPGFIVKRLQTFVRTLSGKRDATQAPLNQAQVANLASFNRFSTSDFFYKSEDLDVALDLMAIGHKLDLE